MDWYSTYGYEINSVLDLITFKQYLEQTIISETINVGQYINELVNTVWKHVEVCLEDENLVYCRLCSDCGELGERQVSNTEYVELRKVVCNKCGKCLTVLDPRQLYNSEDALYMLEELHEINNNPMDY